MQTRRGKRVERRRSWRLFEFQVQGGAPKSVEERLRRCVGSWRTDRMYRCQRLGKDTIVTTQTNLRRLFNFDEALMTILRRLTLLWIDVKGFKLFRCSSPLVKNVFDDEAHENSVPAVVWLHFTEGMKKAEAIHYLTGIMGDFLLNRARRYSAMTSRAEAAHNSHQNSSRSIRWWFPVELSYIPTSMTELVGTLHWKRISSQDPVNLSNLGLILE
jgi:hypothetical protein